MCANVGKQTVSEKKKKVFKENKIWIFFSQAGFIPLVTVQQIIMFPISSVLSMLKAF